MREDGIHYSYKEISVLQLAYKCYLSQHQFACKEFNMFAYKEEALLGSPSALF